MSNVLLIGTKYYDIIVQRLKKELLQKAIEFIAVIDDPEYVYNDLNIKIYSIREISMLAKYVDYVIIADDNITHFELAKEYFEETKIIKGRMIAYYVGFNWQDYLEFAQGNCTIISDSCLGGLLYNRFGREFKSPLINTSVEKKDFLKLIGDLEYYLSAELELYQDRTSLSPPIGILNGEVKIGLNHYIDYMDAKKYWDRRRDRINYENIVILMDSIETQEEINEFNQCIYNKKIAFVKKKIVAANTVYLPQYEDFSIRKETGSYRGYIHRITADNPRFPRPIDWLKLLNGKKDFVRLY